MGQGALELETPLGVRGGVEGNGDAEHQSWSRGEDEMGADSNHTVLPSLPACGGLPGPTFPFELLLPHILYLSIINFKNCVCVVVKN